MTDTLAHSLHAVQDAIRQAEAAASQRGVRRETVPSYLHIESLRQSAAVWATVGASSPQNKPCRALSITMASALAML